MNEIVNERCGNRNYTKYNGNYQTANEITSNTAYKFSIKSLASHATNN